MYNTQNIENIESEISRLEISSVTLFTITSQHSPWRQTTSSRSFQQSSSWIAGRLFEQVSMSSYFNRMGHRHTLQNTLKTSC